jgi:hypothetical protein
MLMLQQSRQQPGFAAGPPQGAPAAPALGAFNRQAPNIQRSLQPNRLPAGGGVPIARV